MRLGPLDGQQPAFDQGVEVREHERVGRGHAEVAAHARAGEAAGTGARQQRELERGEVAVADPAHAARGRSGDQRPVAAVEQARQPVAAARDHHHVDVLRAGGTVHLLETGVVGVGEALPARARHRSAVARAQQGRPRRASTGARPTARCGLDAGRAQHSPSCARCGFGQIDPVLQSRAHDVAEHASLSGSRGALKRIGRGDGRHLRRCRAGLLRIRRRRPRTTTGTSTRRQAANQARTDGWLRAAQRAPGGHDRQRDRGPGHGALRDRLTDSGSRCGRPKVERVMVFWIGSNGVPYPADVASAGTTPGVVAHQQFEQRAPGLARIGDRGAPLPPGAAAGRAPRGVDHQVPGARTAAVGGGRSRILRDAVQRDRHRGGATARDRHEARRPRTHLLQRAGDRRRRRHYGGAPGRASAA